MGSLRGLEKDRIFLPGHLKSVAEKLARKNKCSLVHFQEKDGGTTLFLEFLADPGDLYMRLYVYNSMKSYWFLARCGKYLNLEKNGSWRGTKTLDDLIHSALSMGG